MATTTNYGWTTPDDTALVKDGAAAIRTLGSSVDTTTKNLNPSTTLGDIEYRSSTANTNTRLGIGSSGQALTVVAGVPSWAASSTSVLTTTGDTLYASAANTLARLAIGSTGNILTVAGGVPTWAAPAAAGGMTLISETVASTLSSLSFTSLGSYKQLMLMWAGIRHSTTGSAFGIRFNNNSSSIYSSGGLGMRNAVANTQGDTSDQITTATTIAGAYPFGEASNLAATYTDVFGFLLLDNPTSTTKAKGYSISYSYYNNTASAYSSRQLNGYFDSTTAVTSIDIFRTAGSATFTNQGNSTIRLYGVN
jgi:hypothetical protein